jgi:hypothetical protein
MRDRQLQTKPEGYAQIVSAVLVGATDILLCSDPLVYISIEICKHQMRVCLFSEEYFKIKCTLVTNQSMKFKSIFVLHIYG